jgi:hypothetical protein
MIENEFCHMSEFQKKGNSEEEETEQNMKFSSKISEKWRN